MGELVAEKSGAEWTAGFSEWMKIDEWVLGIGYQVPVAGVIAITSIMQWFIRIPKHCSSARSESLVETVDEMVRTLEVHC